MKILLFIKFFFILHPPFFYSNCRLFCVFIIFFDMPHMRIYIITFLCKYMQDLLCTHSLSYLLLILLNRPLLIRIVVIKIYATVLQLIQFHENEKTNFIIA